jgi:hypothetical protein
MNKLREIPSFQMQKEREMKATIGYHFHPSRKLQPINRKLRSSNTKVSLEMIYEYTARGRNWPN